MWARSMTRSARSSIPQSQAMATLPATPLRRGTSFQPVPRQREQFSRAMRTAYGCGALTARCGMREKITQRGGVTRGFAAKNEQNRETALGSTRDARRGADDGVAGFFIL